MSRCRLRAQLANFQFFLLAAVGVGSVRGLDEQADYFIVINGDECTPCAVLDPILTCASRPAALRACCPTRHIACNFACSLRFASLRACLAQISRAVFLLGFA